MPPRFSQSYKANLKLTEEQREVLVGILLGDGCLETQTNGRTYRLKIEQSVQHEAYVRHLYDLFESWVSTPPKQLIVKASNGAETKSWTFQTISHGTFRFYGQQYYCDRKKHVPKLIHRWLTPRSLAYWYMDNGSMKSSQSKGVILNTQCFERNDVYRLIDVLNDQFILKAKLREQKDGYQIYVSGSSLEVLTNWIEPYLISEMRYKLPTARRTHLPKE